MLLLLRPWILSFVRKVGKIPRRKILIAISAILFLQITYPRYISRPFVFLGGKYSGLKTPQSIESEFRRNANQLYIYLDDQKITTSSDEIGVQVNYDAAKRKLTQYPLWQRLIPLSLLWPSTHSKDLMVTDDQKLSTYINDLYQKSYKPAKNAAAARGENDLYVLIAGENGKEFHKETLYKVLAEMPIYRYNEAHIPSRIVQPIITNSMIEEAIKKTMPNELKPIVVELEKQVYTIDTKTISSWLVININEDERRVDLTYDEVAIEEWIANNPGKVNNSGVPTIITLKDGIEVSRVEGTAGRSINKKVVTGDIKTAIEQRAEKVTAELVTQPVTTQFVRTYSASSTGLKILIDEWQKEYPGMQSYVYIKQLGGAGLFAEKDSNTKIFGASLYKLFVASYLLDAISKGQLDGNQILTAGKSYNQCIDEMIRISDNACPIAAKEKIGTTVLNQYIASHGFIGSKLSDNSTTTAADMGLFMQKLQNSSLLSSNDTSKLLGYMRSQIYRAAIPAGSPGATVADKVGFYDSYWHDAAIVSSSKSSYILVVMTKNGGSLAIKVLAQRVAQAI